MDDSNIINRKVIIKPLPSKDSFLLRNESLAKKSGDMMEYNPARIYRIWASNDKNGNTVRAFTIEEMNAYMPEIIGISHNDGKYHNAVDTFWRNVLIEFSNPTYELNTSFRLYIGNEIEVVINNNVTKLVVSKDSFLKFTANRPELEYKFGRPVDSESYWKWRYCLNSSQVANSWQIAKDKNGKRMEFYLYTKEEEAMYKKQKVRTELQATAVLHEISKKPLVVEGILRTFECNRTVGSNKNIGEYYRYDDLETPDDKLAILIDISRKFPTEFCDLAKDASLEARTFIWRAIGHGVLSKMDGNTMIMYGDDPIGDNMQQAIAYLKKNPKVKDTITMQLKQRILDSKRKLKVNETPVVDNDSVLVEGNGDGLVDKATKN